MVRRFICSAVILGCAGMAALAAQQERATFILTNGDRKSGTVVYHGDDHENLIAGDVNLGVDGGKEISIHVDQVAIIQFVGGRPPMAELESLASNTQAVIRRNGDIELGQFVNMIGGDTLKWRTPNGDIRMIPLRDVTRIYLNPDSARTTFVNSPRGGRTVATTGTVLETGAVRVEANQAWTSTGISVRAGDLVSFRATGQINYGRTPGQNATPAGDTNLRNNAYPLSSMPVGALIGRIENGAPFAIGSNTQPIRMPANGTLLLGVNDNEIGDNGGFFSVVVARR